MKTYTYQLQMLKLQDYPEIEIQADSELARETFIDHWLHNKEKRFFFDKKTNKRYNKEYIYSCELIGEKSE